MAHTHAATGNRLKLAAIATGLFVLAEFLIGLWANSLALVSDAGHNLTDVASLILSGWALAMATRPADRFHTFGHHRVGVLVALANAATLVLLAAYIFYEGYQRLIHPEPVASLPMIIVAILAFALNVVVVLALHSAAHDVNVRSAVVHMAGDALSSVGVLVAGIGVLITGSTLWDPVVSLLIGLFLLWSSWGIFRETVHILLESAPEGLSMEAVARDIEACHGVKGVHDLHAWSLGSNVSALSAHVTLERPSEATRGEVVAIVGGIKQMLASEHHIAHATIETHCSDDDEPACTNCDIHRVETDHEH